MSNPIKTNRSTSNSELSATNSEFSAPTTNLNQKLANLKHELDWFYGEDFSLDQALEKYRFATKLASEIRSDLENLKNQIEIIDQDFTKG